MLSPKTIAPMPMKTSKTIAFSAIAVIGCVLLLELGARLVVLPLEKQPMADHARIISVLGLPALNDAMVFDRSLFWVLKKNLDGFRVAGRIREHDVDFSITTHGRFRSPPVDSPKRRFRILALGDSCTFGLGVADHETWPARLAHRLSVNGLDAEVINTGVPGYTAYQGKRFLETAGWALKPDLLIVGFGFNDAGTWASRSDLETDRRLHRQDLNALLSRSRLYLGLRALWQPFAAAPATTGSGNSAASKEKKPRLTAAEFFDTLAQIQQECRQRGTSLVFLTWPSREQIRQQIRNPIFYQRQVARLCREKGLAWVNLAPAFMDAPGPELFIDHIHANAAGCDVAAEAVFRAVKPAVIHETAPWTEKSFAYWKDGRCTHPPLALADLNRAVAEDPSRAYAYYHRGLLYGHLGDARRSVADLSRTLALNPNFANAHFNRGVSYAYAGDLQRAIADYDEALRRDSKHADAFHNRGNAYARLGDLHRALADLDRAVSLAPKSAAAHNDRGSVHGSSGEYRRAIEDFDRAIALNPGLASAYVNRGITRAATARTDAACADFHRACELGRCMAIETARSNGHCP